MYRLRLNDGLIWRIAGDDDRFALAREMARVMELEPEPAGSDAAGARLVFTGPGGREAAESAEAGQATLLVEGPRSRLWQHADRQDVVCEVRDEVQGDEVYHAMRMAVQAIHHDNFLRGGLTIHGALLEHEGRGVLLAAKGGTGKSTCCRRLPDTWQARCDDETLVARTADGRFVAHPFPTWSHYLDEEGIKTWVTERGIPLAAIFFLERADEDEVVPLPAHEAPMWLYHSIFPVYQRQLGRQLDAEAKRAFKTGLFDNACDMVRTVPCRVLRAGRYGRFWEPIEEVLAGQST